MGYPVILNNPYSSPYPTKSEVIKHFFAAQGPASDPKEVARNKRVEEEMRAEYKRQGTPLVSNKI
eukprot:1361040-Amorphochlora_amoeboformis.AAC.2